MMSKLQILFWIGIIVLFLPFFGVTNAIRSILTIVIGVAVIAISFRLRREYKVLRFRLHRLEQPVVEQTIGQ